MIKLHGYQSDLKNSIYQSWDQGHKNVLAVLPTGGGKSIVVSDIILDGCNRNMRQSVVAHRNELVSQMSIHIARRGIEHKIVGSDSTIAQIKQEHRTEFGKSFIHLSAPTAVVGVDTLARRRESLEDWAQQNDRWVIDEAHHVLRENKWGTAVEMFKNAQGCGVTATAIRADGKGLGAEYDGVFHKMVIGPDARFLIDNHFLSDFEIVCPRSDMQVLDEDKSASGDWSPQYLKKAAKRSKIVGDVVENYIRYAFARKAIVFATDVETAADIAKNFNNNGIPAASLSADTPLHVRQKYISEFKEGKIWVLVNVDLFDEGFDVPDCDVCIMARPTASFGKYRQMVGRALRYMLGKVALIIDHVSNVLRHGLPDKLVNWSLARRDKRGKASKDPDDLELTVCNGCTKPYFRFMVCCPHCGASKPLPEPRLRSVDMVDGDLVLLDRETLNRMRAATILESAGDVAERVGAVAGSLAAKGAANRQIEKIGEHQALQAAIAQWAGIERHKGLSDSEISRKFYLLSGRDVLTALDASQTRAELEIIRKTVEGWYLT